jgi:1,4-dihydroxy-2-naphthoate octaprenyltransferase
LGITVFHAAANVINDYFDTRYQIDQQDSPTAKYRPQPILSGMLTSHQLLGEAIVLFALTLVIGMTAAVALSWHVLWIGVVGFFTSVYYTAGPVKFKYRALGELAVFVIWGPLMVEGAYAVQRQALSGKAFIVSIPFGVLVALVLFANNMRDMAYDSRQNVKTLGTILGPHRSHQLFTGLIVLAYAYVLGMIVTGLMSLWGLLIFLSVPSAISLLKTFKKEIPDMADALTAKFDTIFGILLILAIFLEARVIF